MLQTNIVFLYLKLGVIDYGPTFITHANGVRAKDGASRSLLSISIFYPLCSCPSNNEIMPRNRAMVKALTLPRGDTATGMSRLALSDHDMQARNWCVLFEANVLIAANVSVVKYILGAWTPALFSVL